MRAKDLSENKDIAKELDPGFVRRDNWERGLMFIGVAVALVAIAVALIAYFIGQGAQRDVNIVKRSIQKTPCTLHPEGGACTQIKERIARKGSLRNPCIEHQRVTGTRGRNCKRFYIPPSERETGRPPATHPAPAPSPPPASTSEVLGSRELVATPGADKKPAENLKTAPAAAPQHAATEAPAGSMGGATPEASPPPVSSTSAPSTAVEAIPTSPNPPVEVAPPPAESVESPSKSVGSVAATVLEGASEEATDDVGGLVEGTCERTAPLLPIC
jgi:hypothetical protein